MPLRTGNVHQISETNLGSTARPHSYSYRSPKVDYEELSGDRVRETSESIRARVQAARDIQQKRFSNKGSVDIICNADMHIGEIPSHLETGADNCRLNIYGSVHRWDLCVATIIKMWH